MTISYASLKGRRRNVDLIGQFCLYMLHIIGYVRSLKIIQNQRTQTCAVSPTLTNMNLAKLREGTHFPEIYHVPAVF